MFGQPYQTDDEGGPVLDGVEGDCALVLAEFDGARLSCGKGLTSVFDAYDRNAWRKGVWGKWEGFKYLLSARRISN